MHRTLFRSRVLSAVASFCLAFCCCVRCAEAQESAVLGFWKAQAAESENELKWPQHGVPSQTLLLVSPKSIVFVQRVFHMPDDGNFRLIDPVREKTWSLDLRAMDEKDDCMIGLTDKGKIVKLFCDPMDAGALQLKVLSRGTQHVDFTIRLVRCGSELMAASAEDWGSDPRLSKVARRVIREEILDDPKTAASMLR